jgi:Pyruvate/2-oxoacid:ferredoxin oxidoreductase delta subunit
MGLIVPPVRVTGRCQGCGACLLTCPERAIRPHAGWAALDGIPLHVLGDLCTGCGDCLEVCPVDAIEELP